MAVIGILIVCTGLLALGNPRWAGMMAIGGIPWTLLAGALTSRIGPKLESTHRPTETAHETA